MTAKRRARRQLKFRRWPFSYKRAFALHAWEEEFVMRKLCAHGSGSPREWYAADSDRWNKVYLDKTFARLNARGLIAATGRRFRRLSSLRLVHYTVFTPVYRPTRREWEAYKEDPNLWKRRNRMGTNAPW